MHLTLNRKPKVILLFCPVWDIRAPYASLSYLAGSLSDKADVEIWDLNIEIHDLIFSDSFIDTTYKEIIECSKNEYVVEKAKVIYEVIKGEIDTTKKLLKSNTNYIDRLRSNKILNYARNTISLKYYPSYFNQSNFFFDQSDKIPNLSTLETFLNDRYKNIFLDIFIENFSNKIKKLSNEIIGVSVAGVGQLVPTISILNHIKVHYPEIKSVMGGPLMPYLNESGALRSKTLSFIDHFVIGEGESPLWELLNDNVHEKIITSGSINDSGTNKKFCPTFRYHPLKKYFSNIFVQPYLTTRRCYWNRCKFCSLSKFYSNYTPKKAQELVDDIITMRNENGSIYFMFNDFALPIKTFRDLSTELIKRDSKIFWTALLRFEEELNYTDFKNAYRSGCRMLQFGIESGSQQLLDNLNKGTTITTIEKILKMCKKANIFTNCFLFYNFPTEKRSDFDQTIEFLERNSSLIGTISIGPYRLERLSYVYNNPMACNINSIDYNESELSPYLNYTVSKPSINYNLDEFEQIILNKLLYKKFLPINLPDVDDYQQFFHTICNNVDYLNKYYCDRIELVKKDENIINNNHEFLINIKNNIKIINMNKTNGKIENINNFSWVINNGHVPYVFLVNDSYLFALNILQNSEKILFSHLKFAYCQYFDITDDVGDRDIRYVLNNLYRKECITISD